MCGRFTLATSSKKIFDYFDMDIPFEINPSYNVYPGSDVLIIRQEDNLAKEALFAHWGLIPHWLKEEDISSKWINARIETVDIKPLFKEAYKHKHCLIIADGFYEWKKTKVKQPYYFQLKSKVPFGFAGIWSQWKSAKGKIINSCSLLTTEAISSIKTIHPRMPMIINPKDIAAWLSCKEMEISLWQKKCGKYIEKELASYPVSTYVNNPKHDDKNCISIQT